jgi:hypothetical protein
MEDPPHRHPLAYFQNQIELLLLDKLVVIVRSASIGQPADQERLAKISSDSRPQLRGFNFYSVDGKSAAYQRLAVQHRGDYGMHIHDRAFTARQD